MNTASMAAENMRNACKALEKIRKEFPKRYVQLKEKLA